MKLSTRGEYGLLAVVDIALQPQGTAVQAVQIATRQKISKLYLDQLMLPLKQAGLVESVRGRQGGYRLAREAREITMLDVIAALEGPTTEEHFKASQFGVGVHNVLKQMWNSVMATSLETLRDITIEDICIVYQRSTSTLTYDI